MTEKKLASIILIFLLIIFLIILVISTGSYGGGDSFSHYWISRKSFQYPGYLLSHWGKPLFTVFSAPFSQLGYKGIQLFNIITAIITAFLSYRVVQALNYKNSYLVIIFILFSPIYTALFLSGMTEIFFSFVLIFSIFLFINNKYILSAIIISFIPFARTEGIMFIGLFLIAYLLLKRYKAIPFLFSGFIFYSIAGYFYFHDFFWTITGSPYSPTSQPYGTGSFWYYFVHLNEITGIPLLILLIIGTFIIINSIISKPKVYNDQKRVVVIILIFTSFFVFFLVQSFLWWQGLFSVRGNLRYIACVVPLSAIISLKGYNYVYLKLSFNKIYRKIFSVIVLIFVLVLPFVILELPRYIPDDEKVIKKTADWIISKGLQNQAVYYHDPSIPYYLNKPDQVDSVRVVKYIPDLKYNYLKIADGSLIIWDVHFAYHQRHISLNTLLEHPQLKLLNVFDPEKNFSIWGVDYKVCVFQKFSNKSEGNEKQTFKLIDFEHTLIDRYNKYITDSLSFNGNFGYRFTSESKFSPGIKMKVTELPGVDEILVKASSQVYPVHDPYNNSIHIVISITNVNGMLKYKSFSTKYGHLKLYEWNKITVFCKVEKSEYPDAEFKVYIWHRGNKDVFIDDLMIEVYNLEN